MRAQEFTEDWQQDLQSWLDRTDARMQQGVHNIYNRVGDRLAQKDIARIQKEITEIFPSIRQALTQGIKTHVANGRARAEDLERLDQVLGLITLRTGTQHGHGSNAHLNDSIITIDPWQAADLDRNGLTYVLAHEVGHILHHQFYRTFTKDTAQDPQAGEKLADNIATWCCRQMGINRAEVFNKIHNPITYFFQNRPTASSPDNVHPSIYQRRQSAQQQKFDLSKAPADTDSDTSKV